MISTRTTIVRSRLGMSAIAVATLLPGAGNSQETAAPQMPAITRPLTPPADQTARATVTFADYRYGDLLWENDRTAHRVYGQPLEAHEPPSGSGVDAWGKSVSWPFADRQLKTGDQHGYHGEGVDFYNVGTGRGAGGLGVWSDNKLWVSRNYRSYKIFASGGDVADFQVSYAPWPVDVTRKVWETRRFTLKLGTQLTRLVSTLSSDRKEPLTVGIGIGKRTTLADKDGQVTINRARGIITWWGPETRDEGAMGIALRVDPAMIVDVRQDADNHLLLLRVRPDVPFVYYSGSVWSKGNSGIRDRAAWDRYVAAAELDFTPPPAPASR